METSKFKDFMRNNYLYFFVFVGCFAYIISGLIKIQGTGKTVGEIFASGGLALFFGFFISQLLGMQGMIKGDMNAKVVETNSLHGRTVDEVVQHMDKLDAWCAVESTKAMQNIRRKILSRQGLKYSDYFDEEDNAREVLFNLRIEDKTLRKREWDKYKVFHKAIRAKITPLTTSALTSGGEKTKDPFSLGKTKKDYSTGTASKNIVTKIMCAVLFGCYGVGMVDFSPAILIWTVLQVAVFLIMGAMKFVNSYFFVVDDLRKRTIRQIDILQKFKADIEANPNMFRSEKVILKDLKEKEVAKQAADLNETTNKNNEVINNGN